MSIGRSKFYVDSPSQRHSMFVDHSDVLDLGVGTRDLSSASSSTTLPSAAGSVDRLTGLEEKKSKKKKTFFTLKPSKSSFSLRPFFSTTSLASKEASIPRRRDSSSQTTDERAFDEVGVQTQNASTVDVPVQTSLSGEWDDRNSYGHRMRTSPSFLSSHPSYSFHRPALFPRGPSGGHLAGQSKAPAPRASETGAEGTAVAEDRVDAPLDSRKVLKYATPGDSATAGATSEKAVTADFANVKQIECSATTSSPRAKYFSAKEVKSCCSPIVGITPEIASCQTAPFQTAPFQTAPGHTAPFQIDPCQPATDNSQPNQEISSILSPNEHSSKSDTISNPFVTSGTSGKKSSPGPQVSGKLVNVSLPVDKPSALKIERTDSPVKHSAKIKTVHFDLDDSDSSELNPEAKDGSSINIKKDFEPACLNDSHKQRNLDKDFEDLLRNLDILVDDPIDTSENPNGSDLKISFNSFQSSPPKQTLLSSKLRSAFDVLHQEVLPPILETYENCEVEPPVGTKLNETRNTEIESSEQISKINPPTELVEDSKENKLPSPTTKLRKVENNPNIPKDDSTKSTSPNVFGSSKSDLVEANGGNRENVYESGIRENVIKTVALPTLPSFFDSAPKIDVCSVSQEEAAQQPKEGDENMLSRSSSRGSVRRSDFDGFMNAAKKFDSCENLDQLEEEIIRSLCEPDPNGKSEGAHGVVPAESPDAACMRRVILDRLLIGEREETGGGSNRMFAPEDIIEVPETCIKARQTHKHVATVTNHPNESDHEFPKQIKSTHSYSASNIRMSPKRYRGSSPVVDEIDSPNKNSVFYFSERKPLSAEVPELLPVGLTKTRGQDITSNSNLTNTPFCEPENPFRDSAVEKDVSGDAKSGTCDLTNCLRPSEIHSSSFLDKISSMSSPEKSPLRSVAPFITEMAEAKISDSNNVQCDFANCLKPSQVRNSVFRAELSEITAGKSNGGDSSRANSPPRSRTDDNPLAVKSSSTNDGNARETPSGEKSHKSEVTIVLQTPYGGKTSVKENTGIHDTNQSSGDETVEVSPVYSTKKEPKAEKPFVSYENPPSPPASVQQSLVLASPPLPPPPPPPPSSASKQSIKNNNACKNSLETVLQNPQSNLLRAALPAEPKCAPSKSPVMMELEKRFETTRRRHSCDELDQRVTDQKQHARPDTSDIGSNASLKNRSGSNENSFEFHSPPTATTHQCNSSSSPRERSRNGVNARDWLFSPARTIVTDAPPPPGAVLVDQKVTVDGDRVHTDRFFALPVSEVLRETTTTAKFVPAPPKYEGIGPTEDGVPLAPRNSVKKENMHNWYKTMFKSLHKADSSNDNQEYIIGYSSEPETSKKDRTARKKSSTLDNRSGSNNSAKTNDHLSRRQPYQPPSAKASLDVYSVRPRLIEDYEPGHSSVTDDEITVGYKRYLPALNTPKPSYEYNNGYEQESNFIRNLSPFDGGPDPEQQRAWYKEVQKGGEVPQFGLGKVAPEKPKDPVIGPLPPPPMHYDGPVFSHQATRPLTLPASYQTDNGLCQQSNGPYEMHMRQVIHTELQHRTSPSSSQLSSPSRSILKSPSRSPDLKIPARALFDFRAESTKEIPLKKDDAVLIVRQLDKNWYEGERQGRIGIFPINYVEIVPPEHASIPIQSYTRGSGKVLYDFTAHTSVELSVRKGDLVSLLRRVDANWYEAKCGGRKGIVPASYLQVMQEPPAEKRTPSPRPCLRSPRSSPPSKAASLSPNILQPVSTTPSMIDSGRGKSQSRAKKSSSLIEPVMYRALYSYSPLNSDELELTEGDVVCVVEMCDDGWFVGTSARTGVFGIFPGNYVERAP